MYHCNFAELSAKEIRWKETVYRLVPLLFTKETLLECATVLREQQCTFCQCNENPQNSLIRGTHHTMHLVSTCTKTVHTTEICEI